MTSAFCFVAISWAKTLHEADSFPRFHRECDVLVRIRSVWGVARVGQALSDCTWPDFGQACPGVYQTRGISTRVPSILDKCGLASTKFVRLRLKWTRC